MGPIDISAQAFMLLARTPKECCMFNAANIYTEPMISLIQIMNDLGMEIRLVEALSGLGFFDEELLNM